MPSKAARPGVHSSWTGGDPSLPLASCRGHKILPPDAWFAEQGCEREAAITVCLSCPELTACREWSVSQERLVCGIFGGLSDAERRDERKRRAEAARLAALSAPGRANAAKTHCGTCGRPYSGENLVMVRSRSGMQRGCRACRRESRRRSDRLRRQAARAWQQEHREQVNAARRAARAAARAAA